MNRWMREMRPELAKGVIWLTLLLATSLIGKTSSQTIYLKPGTASPWGGGCDSASASICSESSPCGYSSTTYNLAAVSSCNIYLTSGDWSVNGAFLWANSRDGSATNVTLETPISNLQFQIGSRGPFFLAPSDLSPSTALLMDSWIMYIPYRPTSVAADVLVEKMRFSNSTLTVVPVSSGAPYSNTFIVRDSEFISSPAYTMPMLNWTSPAPNFVLFDSCTFTSQATQPILMSIPSTFPNIIISQTTINAVSPIVLATGVNAIEIQDSSISFSAQLPPPTTPNMFQLNNLATTDTFHTIRSNFTVTNGATGGIPPQLFQTSTALPTLSFEQSTLQGLTLSTDGNPPTSATPITIKGCSLEDVNFSISTPFNISDTLISLSNRGNFIFQNSTSHPNLNGLLANVEVISSPVSSNAFFDGSVVLSSGSSLIVDTLSLGPSADVLVPNLTVTVAIKSTSVSSLAPSLSAPASSLDAMWTFSSISISNGVLVNMSNVQWFDYKATNVAVGIATSPSAHLVGQPHTISVTWEDSNYAPFSGQLFPVMRVEDMAGVADETSVPETQNQAPYHFLLKYHPPPLLNFYIPTPPASPTPIDAPASAHTPTTTPATNDTSPAPTPVSPTCPPPAPNGFTCYDGRYVALGDVVAPTLEIPANAGVVTIFGNLSLTSQLGFNGLGSSINATGCIYLGGVNFNLSTVDPKTVTKSFTQVTLTQGAGCSASLSNLAISTSKSKSCKKVQAGKSDESTATTLVVFIRVDDSACNTKWIIIGASLGGVIIIFVTIALIFTFNDKARGCVRPYAR